jgi:PEP-CTERM motif
MRKPLLFLTPFALASGLTLASIPAHATFVLDTSCGESFCAAGTDFFYDAANHDVSTFTGTVGGQHSGPAVTVDTIGNIDTGAGFATITPASGALLTSLTFTAADDTLFSDFSFRGQLNPVGDTGVIDVTWTDSLGTSGTVVFNGVPGPDEDFDRLGIVSNDGETLASVVVTTAAGESFKEFKQVRFSGAGLTPSVPEPSTWAMMLLGLVGLGYAGYRRANTPRAALT